MHAPPDPNPKFTPPCKAWVPLREVASPSMPCTELQKQQEVFSCEKKVWLRCLVLDARGSKAKLKILDNFFRRIEVLPITKP